MHILTRLLETKPRARSDEKHQSHQGWYMSVILALKRLRQEDDEFKASLST
jgi:hypothetical protein